MLFFFYLEWNGISAQLLWLQSDAIIRVGKSNLVFAQYYGEKCLTEKLTEHTLKLIYVYSGA